MADVMLVLLIIFMITAPLIAAGFQAQMPQGINLISAEEQPDDVVLGIDVNDSLYLNTHPVSHADLPAKLRDAFASHPGTHILYLKADINLKMDKIQEAIKIARDAGVAVVAAVTEQKIGTQPTVSQERAGH